MSTQTLMTVQEFEALAGPSDFELVEGELVPLSSPRPIHQRVRGKLEFSLRVYFIQHPVGETFSEVDCQTGHDSVRRPDVSVFSAGRLQGIDLNQLPMPAPDIAVEIISPSEIVTELNRKTLEYLAAGSREVWLIDYENREVFIQTNSGIRLLRGPDHLETPILPGFSLKIDDLLKQL